MYRIQSTDKLSILFRVLFVFQLSINTTHTFAVLFLLFIPFFDWVIKDLPIVFNQFDSCYISHYLVRIAIFGLKRLNLEDNLVDAFEVVCEKVSDLQVLLEGVRSVGESGIVRNQQLRSF